MRQTLAIVALLGIGFGGWAAGSTPRQELTADQVVDARMHQILSRMLAAERRAHAATPPVTPGTRVAVSITRP